MSCQFLWVRPELWLGQVSTTLQLGKSSQMTSGPCVSILIPLFFNYYHRRKWALRWWCMIKSSECSNLTNNQGSTELIFSSVFQELTYQDFELTHSKRKSPRAKRVKSLSSWWTWGWSVQRKRCLRLGSISVSLHDLPGPTWRIHTYLFVISQFPKNKNKS